MMLFYIDLFPVLLLTFLVMQKVCQTRMAIHFQSFIFS